MVKAETSLERKDGRGIYRYFAKRETTAIVLSGCFTQCSKCTALFRTQLRQDAAGVIRNQPQCGDCR